MTRRTAEAAGWRDTDFEAANEKTVLSTVAAVALATPTLAADMKVKTVAPSPPPNPWDVAFGANLK